MNIPILPETPHAIQKGVPLKLVLDLPAVTQLAANLTIFYDDFKGEAFVSEVMKEIEELALKERALLIARKLHAFLPDHYTSAISILLESLTPPLDQTDELGLSGMFYLPHVSFVTLYGLDEDYNGGEDPFEISMRAQYELTKRFSSEFSIREFLIARPQETFEILYEWMMDPDPHVRILSQRDYQIYLKNYQRKWPHKVSGA